MPEQQERNNLYEILGVSRYASRESIHDAYREIARLYHPDSKFYSEIIDDPVREQHLRYFQQATEAYNTLSDVEKRKGYDQRLGMEIEDWESGDDRLHVYTPGQRNGFQQVRPVLSGAEKGWFRRSRTMNELIAHHHGRKQRRLMKIALSAPFIFILLCCVAVALFR